MSTVRDQREESVTTDQRQEIDEPSLYKVLLHNDDYTTMDFVIMILEGVFHKSTGEATQIMLSVHNKGVGLAGIYTRDIADTKVAVVHEMARQREYPLRCSIEQA